MNKLALTLALVLALALAAAAAPAVAAPAAAAAKDVVRQDVDGGGNAYNPLQCGSKSDCGCSSGYNQCSWCPDDQGSANRYNNVCWCSDLPYGATNTGNECNPAKPNGPYYSGGNNNNNGGNNNNNGGNNDGLISCDSGRQCGCSKYGNPQCSSCPNGGYGNVCWCADAFANGSGQNECRPTAPGGPYKIDVDNQGYSYDPIVCGPGQNQCSCDLGSAKCSQCPFDQGSQWKDYNVCWCDFQGTYTEGFYPHNNNPYGECNPQKYKGPYQNWNY